MHVIPLMRCPCALLPDKSHLFHLALNLFVLHCLARIITVLFCVKCVSGRERAEEEYLENLAYQKSKGCSCVIFCRPIHIQCRAPHICINLILSKSN